MAASKNKRQHFVPQHYLRHFSDGGQIGVAATDPFQYVGKDTTRNQCQANYFYRQGDDDGVDDWLRLDVEPISGKLLRAIVDTKRMTDEELVGVRTLAVIFLLRTRKAAEIAKLMPKWHADIILKDAIERGELPPPPGGYRPGLMDFEGASGMLIKTCLIPCMMEMQTLSQKFLTPESGSESRFITSDHPVVTLNPYLDSEDSDRSFTGFSRAGFQLIFPLSPDCCLMFYDSGVHKVGGKRQNIVAISDCDIDRINGLQVQSADKVLIFHPNTPETEVSRFYHKFSSYRRPLDEHLHRWEAAEQNDVEESVSIKSSNVKLPEAFDFCKTVRNPRTDEQGRRNAEWTEFSQLVSDEFDRCPGDIDEAMKRAELLFLGRNDS